MNTQIPKMKSFFVWVALAGLCFSCSEEKRAETSQTETKIDVSETKPVTKTVDAVMRRIIENYSVTKPSRLSADYDLGYTLFVVSENGIALTADASTLQDYYLDWSHVVVESFSDSGATLDFGTIINLNSSADTLRLSQITITTRPGAVTETPFTISGESKTNVPAHITCETLLVDSSGMVCALGFSSKP